MAYNLNTISREGVAALLDSLAEPDLALFTTSLRLDYFPDRISSAMSAVCINDNELPNPDSNVLDFFGGESRKVIGPGPRRPIDGELARVLTNLEDGLVVWSDSDMQYGVGPDELIYALAEFTGCDLFVHSGSNLPSVQRSYVPALPSGIAQVIYDALSALTEEELQKFSSKYMLCNGHNLSDYKFETQLKLIFLDLKLKSRAGELSLIEVSKYLKVNMFLNPSDFKRALSESRASVSHKIASVFFVGSLGCLAVSSLTIGCVSLVGILGYSTYSTLQYNEEITATIKASGS